MKQFLIGILASILIFAFLHPTVQAQGLPTDKLDIQSTQAVAFVKTDRSILYIKRPGVPVDAYDIAALDVAGGDPNPMDSIRNFAIIGMTPQGDRMIAGASVYYLNQNDGNHYMFRGILSIPWPMTFASLNNTQTMIKFLRYATTNASFRPAGVMSMDGKQWWAITSSNSDGTVPLVFYHGNTDGSGTIDSAVVTPQITGGSSGLQGGFHMSNIAVDDQTKTMFATSFDGLSDQNQSGRVLFYHWDNPGGALSQLSASNFIGSVKSIDQNIKYDFDSAYGLSVFPKNTGGTAYVGMTTQSDNSINFYSVQFEDANVAITSTNQPFTIARSVIPSTENFFAGKDCTSGVKPPYVEDVEAAENSQAGNSGDINFSRGGDTAVFITHEAPYNCSNRGVGSAIWMYDISAQSPSATLVYNDSTAQELQPVFVTALDTIPHSPYIAQEVTSVNFGSVDTAGTIVKTILVTDTSSFDGAILDLAKISGANASDFTITSPKFPDTLKQKMMIPNSVQISVTFAPTLTAGQRNATLTVYSSMSDTLAFSLTGTAQVKKSSGGGVSEDPALQSNIAIDPNPFASQTSVRLTAQDAGTLGIIVHDALGRTVYTSDIRRVGAGATETFAFDAKSLGLSNGVYIVTGLFGDRTASRQVVLTR